MVFTLSFNIAVSRVILQHWQWQSVGYGPVKAVKDLLPHVQLDWAVKVLDCTSAPSWRLKIWNSASTLLLCLDCQRPDVPLPHFRSAFTGKDLKFHVRTFVLHWLPKMWSSASASALPLCLYCQICEVLLPRFRSAFTGKDLKFRFPHLFCQDFQRCEVPLPHFISARTSKDLQFRFCTFAQSWLPKIWRSASPLTLCLHCQIWEVPPPHFPSALTAKDL